MTDHGSVMGYKFISVFRKPHTCGFPPHSIEETKINSAVGCGSWRSRRPPRMRQHRTTWIKSFVGYLVSNQKMCSNIWIWWFPEIIGVPTVIIHFTGRFDYKPAILRYLHFKKPKQKPKHNLEVPKNGAAPKSSKS